MPITDIKVVHPEAYDDAGTILGRPANRQTFTLDGGISVSGVTMLVKGVAGGDLYDLDDLELPCLLVFEGGEIWYIEDGDVLSATTLTVKFSQRAKLGTTPQIHTDGEEVYAYFSGKQHEMLINILRNLEKYPMVQGLQSGAPTLVGEAYIDSSYNVYASFNGSTFTLLSSARHGNLDDIPTGEAEKVHGSQYLNSVDGITTWHDTQTGNHITGGDDHTHLVDASAVKRVASGSSLPVGKKIGQIFLKNDKLYFIYDSSLNFAEFYGVPVGAILPFPPASGCPAGWSEYSVLNADAYVKIKTGGTGTTSGLNTHSHVVSQIKEHVHVILQDTCTSDSAGAHSHDYYISQTIGTIGGCLTSTYTATSVVEFSGGAHSHASGTQEASSTSGLTSGTTKASFSTSSNSSEPPYVQMKWCKKD